MNAEKIKELRKSGKSYKEIADILGVAKSTISYHINPNGKRKNLNRQSVYRREWMDEIKIKFGGACEICGYSRCSEALEFHHKDKKTKIMGVNEAINTRGKEFAEKEAGKCALLCSNCHREVHAGLISL